MLCNLASKQVKDGSFIYEAFHKLNLINNIYF